jgi:DNA-binding XRE family transcriptional regulator
VERKKHQRFEDHLAEQLKDPKFRVLYEKEREALRIGMEVARRRRALGLTQAQLARAVGTSEAAISRLESGDANATVRTLMRVAAALRADWRHRLVPTALEPPPVRAARR